MLDSDKVVDSDCNGIFGYNSDNIPWEDAVCNGTEPRGLVVVGDSVGAHFHMPESWFDVTQFSKVCMLIYYYLKVFNLFLFSAYSFQ